MKRLVIGDIHGHWDGFKKIYDLEAISNKYQIKSLGNVPELSDSKGE